VCVLRYKRHYYTAQGVHGPAVAAEFLEHANDEQRHADLAAERIVQLGGTPDFNPAVLAERSHTEYVPGTDLRDMIQEDLVAERIAIASYTEIARWLGDADPTTRRVVEQLLADEEEHAEDLNSLLARLPDLGCAGAGSVGALVGSDAGVESAVDGGSDVGVGSGVGCGLGAGLSTGLGLGAGVAVGEPVGVEGDPDGGGAGAGGTGAVVGGAGGSGPIVVGEPVVANEVRGAVAASRGSVVRPGMD